MNAPLLSENGCDAESYTVYGWDEIGRHTSKEDCWVVLHGRVLDLTSWLPKHPGGKAAILAVAGQDASTEFDLIHSESWIQKHQPGSVIGVLAGATVTKWLPGREATSSKAFAAGTEAWQPIAQFWRPNMDVELLKMLMVRQNARPLFDMFGWFFLLGLLGCLMVHFRESAVRVPIMLLYGLVYASGAGGREHETGHMTCFKTPMLNKIFYYFFCWVRLMIPIRREDFHAQHHRDTNNRKTDPEIVQHSPPNWRALILNAFYVESMVRNIYAICCHARAVPAPGSYHGSGDPSAKPPPPPLHAVITARIYVLGLLTIPITAFLLGDALPLLLVGPGPLLYGSWLGHFFSTSQHAGLQFSVPDHRLNTRTIYMNPFFRFLYMNMNYHIEHHLYPRVPYYHLPALHAAIKDQCAPANSSCIDAFREIMTALIKQRTDPSFHVQRTLPQHAPVPAKV